MHSPPDRRPRWATPRRLDRPTLGTADVEVARLLGWELFPWQLDTADVAGEYDPVSRLPFYRTVGVAVARQNGKTTLVCTRIARQLIIPRSVVAYTAQDRGIARIKWAEHVSLLMSTPFRDQVANVDRTHHGEMFTMRNGSRYLPYTPSAKQSGGKANALRSLSIDLAVVDEAYAHETSAIIGAIKPAMAARPKAQIYLLSNAGDADSVLWREYTELGRASVDDDEATMCWFEYAPIVDDPIEIDVFDRAAWAAANPSLDMPGGVTSRALDDAARTMQRDQFLREHLNVWVDSVNTHAAIDLVAWAACHDKGSAPGERIAIGLDFTPERDAGCLVVAGLDDVVPLEVIGDGHDLAGLIAAAARAANRWSGEIIIESTSPAASAVPALQKATAYGSRRNRRDRVRVVTTTEFARACGDFYDAVLGGGVAHRNDYRINEAIAMATRRKVGSAWAWDRKGNADITALRAATLARWGIVTAPDPEPAAEGTLRSPAARRLANGSTPPPATLPARAATPNRRPSRPAIVAAAMRARR